MKRNLTALALVLGLCASPSLFAACSRPADPEIPSGETASGADMMKAKKAVETYIEEVQKYVACGVSNSEAKRAEDDVEKVADRFNRELRVYKAKS